MRYADDSLVFTEEEDFAAAIRHAKFGVTRVVVERISSTMSTWAFRHLVPRIDRVAGALHRLLPRGPFGGSWPTIRWGRAIRSPVRGTRLATMTDGWPALQSLVQLRAASHGYKGCAR